MKEKIVGFVRFSDKPIELDNLDFDSMLEIRRAIEKGQKCSFGEYDWRIGGVEIIIERPDLPYSPKPSPQEEWEEKRKWYLEHSENCSKTLRRGLCEGYIICRWPYYSNRPDDRAYFSVWSLSDRFYASRGLDEVCGDMVNAMQDMESEDDERECEEDWLEYKLEEREYLRKEGRDKIEKLEPLKPQGFLRGAKKLTWSLIEKADRLLADVLEHKPWTYSEFKRLGFKFPKNMSKPEANEYVLTTLQDFMKALYRTRVSTSRKILRGLIGELGLDKALFYEAQKEPWIAYETLKQAYCNRARSPVEYDLRLREVLFAIGENPVT